MTRALALLALLLGSFPLFSQQGAGFEELARQAETATGQRPGEAASLYRRALALKPQWGEGWLYLGTTLLEMGRFAESRDALRRGVELEPGKGSAWACLGLAEYELGDYGNALAHLVKGEEIGLADRPDFVGTVRYRASLIALRNADFGFALEQLRPLVRAGNTSPEIVQAVGLSALFIASAPSQIPAARQPMVQLAGQAASAYLAERAEQAAPLFAKLVAEYPTEPGVHYMHGVYLLAHDPVAAEVAFRHELRIAPAHVLSRVQLALLLVERGDMPAGEKLAGEAVKLEPANPLCQVTWGRALLGAGRTDEAIGALEKGRKLAPEAARTYFYLQQAYRRAGRPRDAEKAKTEFDRLRKGQEPVTVPSAQ